MQRVQWNAYQLLARRCLDTQPEDFINSKDEDYTLARRSSVFYIESRVSGGVIHSIQFCKGSRLRIEKFLAKGMGK